MWKYRLNRFIAMVLAGSLAGLPGCAGGRRSLERDDLANPVEAQSYLVTTRSGETWTFISLFLEGETLEGTVRITSVEVTTSPDPDGRGTEERKNVTNRYEEKSIPWSEVARVEAEGVEHSNPSFWLAGGAVVVGVAAFLLMSGNDSTPPSAGGGGKNF